MVDFSVSFSVDFSVMRGTPPGVLTVGVNLFIF